MKVTPKVKVVVIVIITIIKKWATFTYININIGHEFPNITNMTLIKDSKVELKLSITTNYQ